MNTRLKHSARLQPSCWQSLTKKQPKARCSYLSHPSKWKCCAQCWLCVRSHSLSLFEMALILQTLLLYPHSSSHLMKQVSQSRWKHLHLPDRETLPCRKKYLIICMGINLSLFSLPWKMLLNIIILGYVVVIAHLLSLRTPYLLNHLSCSSRD